MWESPGRLLSNVTRKLEMFRTVLFYQWAWLLFSRFSFFLSQELSGQRVMHVRVQSGPHRSSQEPHHYHQKGRPSQGQGAARRDPGLS
ncbi:hypothetical protein CEXT_352071 [Caerostris extrusa]|uniref:Uncharacterized protein n=1 Tax=Caerostris extrusa TaxID=172846 RepID=A0AAV4WLQ3_CAEEX|nr:hypothetical protein CEXT_352071 [Caerostris extrusa]